MGATPAETLHEWAASRGSTAFAEFCAVSYRSMRELADAAHDVDAAHTLAELAGGAAARPDFGDELARVAAAMRRFDS